MKEGERLCQTSRSHEEGDEEEEEVPQGQVPSAKKIKVLLLRNS